MSEEDFALYSYYYFIIIYMAPLLDLGLETIVSLKWKEINQLEFLNAATSVQFYMLIIVAIPLHIFLNIPFLISFIAFLSSLFAFDKMYLVLSKKYLFFARGNFVRWILVLVGILFLTLTYQTLNVWTRLIIDALSLLIGIIIIRRKLVRVSLSQALVIVKKYRMEILYFTLAIVTSAIVKLYDKKFVLDSMDAAMVSDYNLLFIISAPIQLLAISLNNIHVEEVFNSIRLDSRIILRISKTFILLALIYFVLFLIFLFWVEEYNAFDFVLPLNLVGIVFSIFLIEGIVAQVNNILLFFQRYKIVQITNIIVSIFYLLVISLLETSLITLLYMLLISSIIKAIVYILIYAGIDRNSRLWLR